MKTAMHPNYVVDTNQHKKSVILPIDEWETIIAALEELDDIKTYNLAKQADHRLPFRQAIQESDMAINCTNNPLKTRMAIAEILADKGDYISDETLAEFRAAGRE